MSTDELVDFITKVSIGVVAAVTILGPALALFIRRIRFALKGEEERSERAEVKSQILVENNQDALEVVERASPKTAMLLREKLKQTQVDAGVHSDVAPLVDAEKARRTTPVVPLDRPLPSIEPPEPPK